jgi:hypothetical protein
MGRGPLPGLVRIN